MEYCSLNTLWFSGVLQSEHALVSTFIPVDIIWYFATGEDNEADDMFLHHWIDR